MMKNLPLNYLILLAGIISQSLIAQNQKPVISNLSATVDWQQEVILLDFDLTDAESDLMEISLKISGDGGKSFFYPVANLSGDGYPVSPGTSKQIIWDYNDTINDFSGFIFLMEANDRQTADIQELVDQVDSGRIKNNLSFIEGIRHRTAGPAHLQAIRDSLWSRYERYDLFPWKHTFTFNSNYQGENIIGSSAGILYTDSVVIIDAHYDGVANSPGADDNGSGVAGLMEAARILSQYSFDKSIKFISFDLEESGLIGSHHYVNNGGILPGENISGVLNFEMIGYYSEKPNSQSLPPGFSMLFPNEYAQLQADSMRGNFIAGIGNTNSAGLNNLFFSSAQQYVPALKVIDLNVPGNGSIAPDFRRSDHSMFWDAGYKALMLTDASEFRNPNYHSPNDVMDSLDPGFMMNVVKATVATVANLAGLRHGSSQMFSVSNPVNILETKWQCDFTIFTQSDRSVIALDFGNCNAGQGDVKLADQSGRLILQHSFKNIDGELNIKSDRSLSKGVYILQLHLHSGVEINQKFIVQ